MSLNFDNAIWVAGMVTEIVIIALLTYRRVWRTLPIFCSYLVWDILSNVGAFVVIHYFPEHYFQVFFAEAIVDSALILCVLVELAWSVLRPVRSSLPRSALVLVGVLILVAGAAIWPFTALPGLAHSTSRNGLLYTQLIQTVSILRILFFLVLAGGSQLLSIGWRDRELQVATGLGLYSFASLAVAVLDLHQTTASQVEHLNQIVTAGYVCCLLYWGCQLCPEGGTAQGVHATDAEFPAGCCRRSSIYARYDDRFPRRQAAEAGLTLAAFLLSGRT